MENNVFQNYFSPKNKRTNRMLRFLSIMTCFLFAGIIPVFAENTSSLQTSQHVTINMQNVELERALSEIEKQTGYLFIYSDQIEAKQKVSVKATNKPINQVLNDLSKTTNINYQIEGSHIILSSGKNEKTTSTTSTPNQQTKVVIGLVTDAQKEPLVGVSVTAKGTSVGTITDINGKYSIKIKDTDVLVFSYVGYTTQEVTVGNRTSLAITLEESSIMLKDIVVTALGIKKEAKALTYNVQTLKSDEVTAIKDPNFINSLAGKVAGVQINSSASGIGGSSRVIMRGTKSLFGNNNALYVVDGVPLINTRNEQPGDIYESPDGGDGDDIALINPDDVESMSVLTGAAAAALYGSQGANGVILITTKRGKEGKLKVNYSNGTTFMNTFVMPKFQNTYGSEEQNFMSWGEKLNKPSSFHPKDFFQTGYNETNSLDLSFGTERNQSYFSVATLNARGIIPNNDLERYNINFRNTADLVKDVLSMDFGVSYVLQKDLNMMSQGQYHNPLLPLYLFPRGDDFEQYRTYERYNAERNFKTQFWPYGNLGLGIQNPYWIVNRERFENRKDRYSFTLSLKYNILKGVNITGRARMDNTETTFTRKISASSDLLFASKQGNYLNQKTTDKQLYADVILNIDKRLADWNISANLGASLNDRKHDVVGFEGHLVTVPNLFSYNNIDKNHPETKFIQNRYHDQSQAIFATAQVGYNSLVFLDLTARNEWPSQLAFAKSSSYFFPSVGLSGIISDMVKLPEHLFSFMKVRVSYSEVGNAPLRYLTSRRYSINNGAISMLPIFPQYDLKAERTKAYEAGTQIRLLDNRIDLNFTYYNSNTYHQLFEIESAPSTGYSRFFLNAGKVNNWGIETSLGYIEKFGAVTWHSNLTYSLNRNKIKKLLSENTLNPITGEPMPAMDEFIVSSSGSYRMILKEGGTMGDIYVSTLKKDHQGYIHVNPESGTVSGDPKNWIKAGSVAPKYNLSCRNSLAYKGFNLSFLIDARVGGIGVSATQALMDRYGVSENSAKMRDEGGVPLYGGHLNPENYYAVVGGGSTGILSEYIYSSTNVRLREASLGYTFPAKWFKGHIDALSVSLIGKNLFMIYNKAPYDPEVTASTDTYYQGIDYFMQPSLRSIGFSVKVQF